MIFIFSIVHIPLSHSIVHIPPHSLLYDASPYKDVLAHLSSSSATLTPSTAASPHDEAHTPADSAMSPSTSGDTRLPMPPVLSHSDNVFHAPITESSGINSFFPPLFPTHASHHLVSWNECAPRPISFVSGPTCPRIEAITDNSVASNGNGSVAGFGREKHDDRAMRSAISAQLQVRSAVAAQKFQDLLSRDVENDEDATQNLRRDAPPQSTHRPIILSPKTASPPVEPHGETLDGRKVRHKQRKRLRAADKQSDISHSRSPLHAAQESPATALTALAQLAGSTLSTAEAQRSPLARDTALIEAERGHKRRKTSEFDRFRDQAVQVGALAADVLLGAASSAATCATPEMFMAGRSSLTEPLNAVSRPIGGVNEGAGAGCGAWSAEAWGSSLIANGEALRALAAVGNATCRMSFETGEDALDDVTESRTASGSGTSGSHVEAGRTDAPASGELDADIPSRKRPAPIMECDVDLGEAPSVNVSPNQITPVTSASPQIKRRRVAESRESDESRIEGSSNDVCDTLVCVASSCRGDRGPDSARVQSAGKQRVNTEEKEREYRYSLKRR